jgi:hypothetical protein
MPSNQQEPAMKISIAFTLVASVTLSAGCATRTIDLDESYDLAFPEPAILDGTSGQAVAIAVVDPDPLVALGTSAGPPNPLGESIQTIVSKTDHRLVLRETTALALQAAGHPISEDPAAPLVLFEVDRFEVGLTKDAKTREGVLEGRLVLRVDGTEAYGRRIAIAKSARFGSTGDALGFASPLVGVMVSGREEDEGIRRLFAELLASYHEALIDDPDLRAALKNVGGVGREVAMKGSADGR